MAVLPDWMIERLCLVPTTHWTPPERDGRGKVVEEIPNGGVLVTPFDPEMIGTSTIDMRLGTLFSSPQPMSAFLLRGKDRMGQAPAAHLPNGSWEIDGGRLFRTHRGADGIEVVLESQQALACQSAEYYRLPPDVCGRLFTKSSRGREWLEHGTASNIDPGFQGPIVFEIRNTGARQYSVRAGMRVTHLALEQMAAPARNPYFLRANAKYRGQPSGVQSADPNQEG
jgi:dCTP deaminase